MDLSVEDETIKQSLNDVCVYDAKAHGDDFVGIKYENKKLTVQFPYGYRKPETEKEQRKDILNLISVLQSFSDHEDSYYPKGNSRKKQKQFPIHSYIHLITNFMNYGYYKETDVIYKKNTSGKISWNRTIKQITPQLIENKSYYFEFITRNTNYNMSELITKIHEYLVYESFEKIGFIFCSFTPSKPTLKFNAKLFSIIIKLKMSKTFNERNLLLFKAMLDIIDYLDNASDNQNYYYGVNKFDHIWESMIDNVYGIDEKQNYYPRCYWNINGREIDFKDDDFRSTTLRPDTIMITRRNTYEQKIFILDAKNYKYGIVPSSYNLPASDSITKQIAYGDYIYNKEESGDFIKSKGIYNAFILPYNSNKDSKETFPKVFGYASSDYVDNEPRDYYKIWGILIDVKNLMYNHRTKDTDAIKKLAELIEKGI